MATGSKAVRKRGSAILIVVVVLCTLIVALGAYAISAGDRPEVNLPSNAGDRPEVNRESIVGDRWQVGVEYPVGDFARCGEDDAVADSVMSLSDPTSAVTFTLAPSAGGTDAGRVAECLAATLASGPITVYEPTG